ncbi:MAG: AraC family transcriptional activator of pobA [Paracoccaceae bacterium]|jgi:AraC family transcriptional activator of pobA
MQYPTKSAYGQKVEVYTLPGLTSRGRWRMQSLQSREKHVFLWFTRGQGQLRIGSILRGFGPNTVIFIPAGQIHAVIPSANAQGYASFLPETLPVPVPHSAGLIKATSIFDQGQMTGYFEQISAEHSNIQPGFEHVIESYLTLLSVWIERNHARNEWLLAARPTAAQRLLDRFLRRLEDNHQLGLAVSTYAAVLDVTPTHLSRVCREVAGKPALELVQDRVVLAAKYGLAESDIKINEIATSLGFSSAAYFTRLFRQSTLQSPREFRLQARSQNTAERRLGHRKWFQS